MQVAPAAFLVPELRAVLLARPARAARNLLAGPQHTLHPPAGTGFSRAHPPVRQLQSPSPPFMALLPRAHALPPSLPSIPDPQHDIHDTLTPIIASTA